MELRKIPIFLLLFGCVSSWRAPDDFIFLPIKSGEYDIATWQKITSSDDAVHIYIEGDGRAFDSAGRPTFDPTPRGTFLRDIAMSDSASNVVYMARPCQFIKSDACTISDWTDGRFSRKIIESVAYAVKQVSGNKPIILIGYSGGAMVSGLLIENHPELDVKKWITIAGVLNHSDWTGYFGDAPLDQSMNIEKIPSLPQIHYVAEKDKTVPLDLSKSWLNEENMVVISDATHDDFKMLEIDFSY